MTKLRGKLIRETEKAILFEVMYWAGLRYGEATNLRQQWYGVLTPRAFLNTISYI
jgi:hypothetical protein